MFRPVEMLKLNVLVLEKYLNGVTRAVGELGLIHLVDAVSQSPQQLLHGVDRQADITQLEQLHGRCRRLLDGLGVAAAAAPAADVPSSLGSIEQTVTAVETQFQEHEAAVHQLLEESGLLHREAATLADYPLQQTRIDTLRDLSHLYIATGRIAPAALPELRAELAERGLVLGDTEPGRRAQEILVLSSRKNRWAVESELKEAGFEATSLPADLDDSVAAERRRVESEAQALGCRIEEHRVQVAILRDRHGVELAGMARQLSNALAVARAQAHFGQTEQLFCISGWVPRPHVVQVREAVEVGTGGTGIVEIIKPERDARVRAGEENIPVMFQPNQILRPFQQLVGMFGAPRYQELEPSLFVALSFVVMFGIMFGDVGQGAVMMAAGLLLRRSRRPRLAAWRDAGMLLLLCGLSAAVFGVLYGSVFGAETLLPALWLHPLHDVMRLFKFAVGVGIACISVGIFINIYNRIRARRYFESVVDKFGVIGVMFYWGSLGVGLKAAKAGTLAARDILLFVVLPLAILFLREPLQALLTRKKRLVHGNVFSFILESSIEIMETVTTFLGSTVSFIRVGGFALSHAALCLAIFSVVEMLRGLPWGGVWALLVIVLGNLLVILMEGMIVMIQGVRLQFYELFGKYFAGDGVLYAPFQLAYPKMNKEEN